MTPMRHRLVLAGLLMLAALSPVEAQPSRFDLRVRVGAQTQDLRDVRAWQRADRDRIAQQAALDVRETDTFPTRPALSVELGFPVGRGMGLGAAAGVTSTGGRLHYADYSGELYVNRVLTRTTIGLFYEQSARSIGQGHLIPGLHLRAGFTAIGLDTGVRLADGQADEERLTLSSMSFSVEPRVALELPVRGPVSARLDMGYEYDFRAKLKLSGEAVGVEGSGRPMRTNWSGFRVGLSVGYRR